MVPSAGEFFYFYIFKGAFLKNVTYNRKKRTKPKHTEYSMV